MSVAPAAYSESIFDIQPLKVIGYWVNPSKFIMQITLRFHNNILCHYLLTQITFPLAARFSLLIYYIRNNKKNYCSFCRHFRFSYFLSAIFYVFCAMWQCAKRMSIEHQRIHSQHIYILYLTQL